MEIANRAEDWKKNALGNFDEAVFWLSNIALKLTKPPAYISDQTEFEKLLGAVANFEPDKVFQKPTVPSFELKPAKVSSILRMLSGSPNHYQAYTFEYPSLVNTGYPQNDIVRGHYLECTNRPHAPALIYLHGWREFDSTLGLRLPLAWFGPAGYHILMLHFPFHFERTPKGTLSGQLSLTGNLPLTITGVQQAISDVRQAIYWLRQRHSKVGLMGKSLGGLIGSTTLIVEEALDAAALLVPATNSYTSVWKSTYTEMMRQDLRAQGLDEQKTWQLFEALRPANYPPRIEPQKILTVKAIEDRVCFPADTDTFVQRWNTPVVEVPTGHLTVTLDKRVNEAVVKHFETYLNA